MCDLVNYTRFPKEDHVPDWVCRDKHGNNGDRVEHRSLEPNFTHMGQQTWKVQKEIHLSP